MIEFLTLIEIVAVIFGLVSVYLTVKQHIWCWPTGIVMVVLYLYIFFVVRLYSDFILQIFFLITQFYGWYFWIRGPKVKKKSKKVRIARLTSKQIIIVSAATLIGSAALGYFMSTYTDASLPYYDAFTTVLNVVGQILLTKKIFENWSAWIIADVGDIAIYAVKGLYWTSGLYFVFLLLCIKGYREWKADYRKQTKRAA